MAHDLMEETVRLFFLQRFLTEAAEMGARLTLSNLGKVRPYLNKTQAFTLYGRRNVNRWIAGGLITPRKDGEHSAAWRLEWLELESVHRAERLIRYL